MLGRRRYAILLYGGSGGGGAFGWWERLLGRLHGPKYLFSLGIVVLVSRTPGSFGVSLSTASEVPASSAEVNRIESGYGGPFPHCLLSTRRQSLEYSIPGQCRNFRSQLAKIIASRSARRE